MWEKFKSIVAHEQIFASVLIILVGVISFGLGRTAVPTPDTNSQTASIELAPEPFIIHAQPTVPNGVVAGASTATTETDIFPGTTHLVASKSGSRYHLLTCPGAKQIKESNKVFFATVGEAEAAGYTKAANCPGL